MSKKTETVAGYIKRYLNLSSYTRSDVARKLGYKRPNVISMLKNGHTDLPLSKVGPIADLLEMNPEYLLKLVLSEYYPAVFESLKPVLEGLSMTEQELDLVYQYREIRKADPSAFIEINYTHTGRHEKKNDAGGRAS